MINGNFIKVNRSILNWEWYDDLNTFKLFLHLLLTVNWKDGKWRGEVIQRGQRVVSLDKLSEETKLTKMQIRNSIKKLILTQEITQSKMLKTSMFTIVNYDKYQTDNTISDIIETQIAPSKEHRNNIVITSIEERKEREEGKEVNNIKDIVAFPTEKTTEPKFTIDSFEMLCVETLIHSCLEVYPNSKVPSTQRDKEKWAVEIERMKKLDKRSEEDITKALQFAISDSFWKGNIRSAKKFREKFETLLIQSKNSKKGAVSNKQSFDEYAAVAMRFLESE